MNLVKEIDKIFDSKLNKCNVMNLNLDAHINRSIDNFFKHNRSIY